MSDGFDVVLDVAELPAGAMRRVHVGHRHVLVVNTGSGIHALADACGHQRAPLSRGRLRENVVQCPLHFARFDVTTGHLVGNPAGEIVAEGETADLEVFDVRVEDGKILVRA